MQSNSMHVNFMGQFDLFLLLILTVFLTFSQQAKAEELEQINLDSNGVANNARGEDPFISSTGRFVVFIDSFLLPADVRGEQAYIFDRQTKTLELVSQAADGSSANVAVRLPSYAGARVVSEDGRYVVFRTPATNLPGTLNPDNLTHVWLRDRQAGTTSLVSRSSAGNPANQRSWDFSIAPDGWAVLFNSSADNLDADDSDNKINTYLHDLRELNDRRTKLACFDTAGDKITQCDELSLSCTGLMAFVSGSDKTGSGDTHFGLDLFFGNPLDGNNVIISVGAIGQPANSIAFTSPAMACDGQRIAFGTKASLSLADSDDDWDLYVHDISTGTARLIRGPANISFRPTEVAISPNGKWIAFRTMAALDSIDTNGFDDIYAVHFSLDRTLGAVRLVSQNDGEQANTNGSSVFMAIADNGAVAFESHATNFGKGVDVNGNGPDIFVNAFNVILDDGFE